MDIQYLANCRQEVIVNSAKVSFVLAGLIKTLDSIGILMEIRCLAIIEGQSPPVIMAPFGVCDLRFIDFLEELSAVNYRDAEPLQSFWGFDFIAIAPVTSRILHIIIENKFVYHIDDIKISFPGDVIRMQNGYFFHYNLAFPPV